jgi:hypothetical protein
MTETAKSQLSSLSISVAEARKDDDITTMELPEDLVGDHLTTTFTPERYAKVCRDVAYFTSRVGKAPAKNTGGGIGQPGSGMRRAKEGALYDLAHRKALLKRAVELDFITITNEDGFEAEESDWRFAISDRGRWFLQHYYGNHSPVRRVYTVKLSRYSSSTNIDKIIVDPSESIKPFEKWQQQTESTQQPQSDISSGNYHIDKDTVTTPKRDPEEQPLVTWIDKDSIPTQLPVGTIESGIEIKCDLESLNSDSEKNQTIHPLTITLNEDSGTLVVDSTEKRAAEIHITHAHGDKFAIRGDYDPFVTSGAKDIVKEKTNATYSDEYKQWVVEIDELLIAIEGILTHTPITEIHTPADSIASRARYF